MSAADAIASLGTVPVTVIGRTYSAVDSAGRAQPDTTSQGVIQAQVQPVAGTDLQALPEGTSASDALAVYTTAVLSVGDAGTARRADVIEWHGEQYEVTAVEVWTDYLKATAIKMRKAAL